MNEHPNTQTLRSAYEAVARGDMETLVSVLAEDIVWHESMPGFEGTYHGRDEAMSLLGRVFAETGMEVVDMAVDHVLADDTHATVVLETTVGIGDRRHHGRYVDVYRLRDGTAIEHWHLPFDPSAEAAFFGGRAVRRSERRAADD